MWSSWKIKVQVKRVFFVITEKPRVDFAKYVWMEVISKISEEWFCKYVFLTLFPVKNIYLSKSCIWNAYVEVGKKLG
jgi:hypothetical protein